MTTKTKKLLPAVPEFGFYREVKALLATAEDVDGQDLDKFIDSQDRIPASMEKRDAALVQSVVDFERYLQGDRLESAAQGAENLVSELRRIAAEDKDHLSSINPIGDSIALIKLTGFAEGLRAAADSFKVKPKSKKRR